MLAAFQTDLTPSIPPQKKNRQAMRLPPPAAAWPALCLACNWASMGLLCGSNRRQDDRRRRLQLQLALLLPTTAIQHWTAVSDFDDDDDGFNDDGMPPSFVLALQLVRSPFGPESN